MPPKRLGPLGRLSCGERLIIDRRRRNETQEAAGKRHGGWSAFTYGGWEQDNGAGPLIRPVERLKMHERCLLYRRRAGTSQAEIARDLGRSRWQVNQMERGEIPCDELLSYWEK